MNPSPTTCNPCLLTLGLAPHHDPGRNRYDFKTLTAIHEASHAVCALHLGRKVLSASIKPEGLLLGRRRYSGVCWYVPGRSRSDKRIAGVAGVVAEAVFLGWNEWNKIEAWDFNSADGRDLNPDNVWHAVSRAREILIQRWQFVLDLAELLESDGSLSASMIDGFWRCELAGDYLRERRSNKEGQNQ